MQKGFRLRPCHVAGHLPVTAAGLEDPVMNELLNILPWAFGLVAAAAAVNLSR